MYLNIILRHQIIPGCLDSIKKAEESSFNKMTWCSLLQVRTFQQVEYKIEGVVIVSLISNRPVSAVSSK